jgi:membrane fusion protein (multidrug efflux system)
MSDPQTIPPGVIAESSTNPRLTQPSGHPIPPLRRLVWLSIVLVAATAAIAGVVWFLNLDKVTTSDAQVDAHLTAVSPKISGYVENLSVDDNTPVKGGDILVRIDPRDYRALVDQAVAVLDLATAQAESARLNVGLTRDTTQHETSSAADQQDSDGATLARSQAQFEQAATAALLQAKANVEARRATNERAQSDLSRYTPLLATQDVSKFQYDAVEAAARVAKSELDAADQQLAAAQQSVDIAKAAADSAKAQLFRSQEILGATRAREQQVPISEVAYKSATANVAHARAALETAKLNLSYCKIVAPISGQITHKTVQVGDYVSPGQLLFTIVPLDQVFVTANFKETQMEHVHPGQRAVIHVDTYDQDFEGTVESIAGASGSVQALLPPQNATGNFVKVVQRIPVKILVKPGAAERDALRPGMNVEATIYTR